MFKVTEATPMEIIETMGEECSGLLQDILTLQCVFLCKEYLLTCNSHEVVDDLFIRLLTSLKHGSSELHQCAGFVFNKHSLEK